MRSLLCSDVAGAEVSAKASTRTPLRVTLGGGGTDLPSYYRRSGGFIFAMALDKYIDVHCHRPCFDSRIYVNGEAAESVSGVRHDIARAALQRYQIKDCFGVASLADISGGTGLGSSSCFSVGLLHALAAMHGHQPKPAELAEEACDLEMNTLSQGIGKQDQYMAAFGGLTTLDITSDGTVTATAITLAPYVEAAFIKQTHIYYTGRMRQAAVILDDQNTAMMDDASERHRDVEDSLDSIRHLGHRILDAWQKGNDHAWGCMLHEHWEQKKRLSKQVSWPQIDALYEFVRSTHGVLGGKVIGAGGGGFLMLFCPGDGKALEDFMVTQGFPRLHYAIEKSGSRILNLA